MLPRAEWLAVVRNAPLVSIDLILLDPERRILLGWRRNEPARDCWVVPGGAVRKNETLDGAFTRIAATELGLQDCLRAQARLRGAYEHFYQANFAGVDGFGTHYVVLAHELEVAPAAVRPADAQHSELRWFSRAEALAEPAVHPYARAYFD